MQYRIISPRVGTPGDIYQPEVWVNIGVLIEAGFIEPIDKEPTQDIDKPAKKTTKKTA